MRDGKPKKSKLSWTKSLFKKWFQIKSKKEEFPAHELAYAGGEAEWRASFSERQPSDVKKTKTEKFSLSSDRFGSGGDYLKHPKIIDVQNHSVFVATWNVSGKSPPSHMNLDDWLHASPAADIYVLGFQEIVPLNPSNILGTEDNCPAKKWVSLIRKTLNNRPGMCGSSGNHTPSPIPNPAVEINADFDRFYRHRAASFFPRRSFQATESWKSDYDPSTSLPQLERRHSVCERDIFGHRLSNYQPSDFRPSDYRPSDYRPSDYSRTSDYSASDYRPSDCRPSDFRPSDFSRWGSSDEDYGPDDSPSTLLSPMSCGGSAHNDIFYRPPKQQRYCLVVSKQMVGIFLTVWVRKDLREHVCNVKISCVGRGLMGYLGNKGSISVSLLLHQTSFCFVCSHLTSGQKEGDELRRNADVMEILKKTRFPQVSSMSDEMSPETIVEHDRVIWLGDLNYRLTLSYRPVRALVQMQNWRALLERDQLRIEQKRGRVFIGWKEGKIYFPPTYKYSHNSDRYVGDDMHHKKNRRTPAWCDRILWYGNGLHQLSYVRAESRFSDHRPVYSMFWAEVESMPARFRKSMSCSRSQMEVGDLLPYTHGYTELCFF